MGKFWFQLCVQTYVFTVKDTSCACVHACVCWVGGVSSGLFGPVKTNCQRRKIMSNFIFTRCISIVLMASFYSEVQFLVISIMLVSLLRFSHFFHSKKVYFLFSLTLKETVKVLRRDLVLICIQFRFLIILEESRGNSEWTLMKSIVYFKLYSPVFQEI